MYDATHQGAVPQISIDGEMIIGFNEPLLRQKLGISNSITTTTPPPTTAPPTTTLPPALNSLDTIPEGNLAPNFSFEDGFTVPTGWVSQVRGTDATFLWQPGMSYSGEYAIGITGSCPGNIGWPGWETAAAIPIDPTKKYEFKADYYVPDTGMLWMDIQLIDSTGKFLGGISTGTSSILPQTSRWLVNTLTLDPGALSNDFPDIASVRLGLRLSLNWSVTKFPSTTVGTIYYDMVSFAPVGASSSPRPAISPSTVPAPATTGPPTTTYPTQIPSG